MPLTKSRTYLAIYDIKSYFIHPNPENLSFAENFLKSNIDALPYELDRICDGRFNRVVLAESRPTSTMKANTAEEKIAEDKKAEEETKFALPVMQQAFQHKLDKNVEVVFDPLWHSLSEAADNKIKQIPAVFAQGKSIDEKAFFEMMEKYAIADIVALVHRAVAEYPADEIFVQIYNTQSMEENKHLADFFEKYPGLFPNSVVGVELGGPSDITFKYVYYTVPEKPIVGKLIKPLKFAPELEHTTASAWQSQNKIPADILFDSKLTNTYWTKELKAAPPPPSAQEVPKPVVPVQTETPQVKLPTITLGKITAQRISLLEDYKKGDITIASYMAANLTASDTSVFTEKNILDMLRALAMWNKWAEKGKGGTNPMMWGKPHTPHCIRRMRTDMPSNLVTLRKDVQAKLDDRVDTMFRSRTTQQFYELIVAMPKFENNNLRDMGIRAFCARYDINYNDIVKQANAPELRGDELEAMKAVYSRT